jgi:endonuclease-3
MLLIIKIRNQDIDSLLSKLRILIQNAPLTLTEEIKKAHPSNVYLLLISCLLSLRTRDIVTWPICQKFFQKIQSPQEMIQLSILEIETAIKSINFYKRKAQVLHQVSRLLVEKYAGQVPQTQTELLSLPGVGLKTANLILAEGFNIPAICVDTHVHRLSNRWRIVTTKTANETEQQLSKILPQKYWIDWNRILVLIGQTVCRSRCKGCDVCTYFDSEFNS